MSGKLGIIIQARMSSSRLPGKSLMKIGPHPLIYYVIKRLELVELPVFVCTSTHSSDNLLCDYLDDLGINFFRGSLENVLERYIRTAEAFGIDHIVRITGDNPLVDFQYLKQSLALFSHYSYVDGIYAKGLIKGTGFELVKLSELRKITSPTKEHQEHVTLWLRENLNATKSRIQLKPNATNEFRNDVFLTCDYEEDMLLLKKIFEDFHWRVDVSLSSVLKFLDSTPSLKEINCPRHRNV